MISKIIQLVSSVLLLAASVTVSADEVVRWNRVATEAAAAAQTDPLTESRIFAREVAIAQQLDVVENARLFALVNLAMADGFIGGFEAKYHYNYWRPATAIREAGDSSWVSYLWTPPVPDYPSTHTVLGAAAAAGLERFFGTDFVNFTMTSGAPYAGITRKFWSFSEAARENGASRVLAGIHFSTAVNAGYLQGSRIGTWVFEQVLRPVSAPRAVPASAASAESSR
ncbi:vanadium-dependent haloperoxidase [candidate division KSB1 bacterium]|nr:vanadium-dependent haloperoxidase [candidate division KSB1 bacterium]